MRGSRTLNASSTFTCDESLRDDNGGGQESEHFLSTLAPDRTECWALHLFIEIVVVPPLDLSLGICSMMIFFTHAKWSHHNYYYGWGFLWFCMCVFACVDCAYWERCILIFCFQIMSQIGAIEYRSLEGCLLLLGGNGEETDNKTHAYERQREIYTKKNENSGKDPPSLTLSDPLVVGFCEGSTSKVQQ